MENYLQHKPICLLAKLHIELYGSDFGHLETIYLSKPNPVFYLLALEWEK